jgi:spoIIIJ-associated protein
MENDDVIGALRSILEKLVIPIDGIDVSDVAGRTLLTVRTKDSGILIGSGGETLHALNHLIRRMFESKTAEEEPFRFVVDVNGYHLQHIREIEGHAKMLAERARTFQHDVDMSPMSGYDRMIVHASLQGVSDVTTKSEGEGKLRHVVIKYAGAGAVPVADAHIA